MTTPIVFSQLTVQEQEMQYKFFGAAICLVLSVCGSSIATPTENPKSSGPNILGTWEGESKCTAPDSACHDEHIIYRIAIVKHVPGRLALHGYKVVKGQLIFMGTLECLNDSNQATLSCSGNTPKKDAWEFKVSGRTMTGTLTIGEKKTLYRRINVKKK
jgi:hypothetical protein